MDLADVVAVLSRALTLADPEVRMGAAAALRWLGARAGPAAPAGPALTRALEDDTLRRKALKALRDDDDSRQAEVIETAELRVLYLCAEALVGVGPPARAAVPALVRTLIEANGHVRSAADRTLSPPRAALISLTVIDRVELKSDWVRPRASAMSALERIGPDAAPALIAALADDDAEVRSFVAGALGRFGDSPQAGPALARLLAKDTDFRVRHAAAGGLARTHHYDASLIRAMGDADVGVRRATLHAVEHTGGLIYWDVVLTVAAALGDKDARVRGAPTAHSTTVRTPPFPRSKRSRRRRRAVAPRRSSVYWPVKR